MGTSTVISIRMATKPGKYGDGLGLYLNVARGGSKSWIQRITIDGKRREIGLGGLDTISLARVRDLTLGLRVAVAEGLNPLFEKRETTTTLPNFREATLSVHRMNLARLSNEKYCENWLQRAEKYVLPALGVMPLGTIGRRDVLGILEPIWTTKQETARRVRQIMRLVFAWGMAKGYIGINPAGETVSAALPTMPKFREHMRTVHYSELPGALETIRGSTSRAVVKLALEFLTLTAARSGEVPGGHLG